MTAKECFELLVTQIHVTVAAAADEDGAPVTCIVNAAFADDNGLYFLTEKDGDFCKQLKSSGYAACSGIRSEDPLHGTAVSVRGRVREAGADLLPQIFAEQKYLAEKYPDPESRAALTAFCLYEGSGTWETLSGTDSGCFTFGDAEARQPEGGYFVTDICIGCGACADACPAGAIEVNDQAEIRQADCLRCGNCADTCPVGAIEQA